jgi:hypothetical protein
VNALVVVTPVGFAVADGVAIQIDDLVRDPGRVCHLGRVEHNYLPAEPHLDQRAVSRFADGTRLGNQRREAGR